MLLLNNLDLSNWLTNLRRPLSLMAQAMLINSILDSRNPNTVFPHPPAITNNKASYMIIVRQNGVVIEGRYTLHGIPPSMYTSILCIYYNNFGQEIGRTPATGPSGYCLVQDDGISGLTKLEMQVVGNLFAPSNGLITIDGSYMPTPGRPPNFSTMLGGPNSEICTSMDVKASNMPPEQIKVDNLGALLWVIVPQRLFENSICHLRYVVLTTQNFNVGDITVIPYVQQYNDPPRAMRSVSGVSNMRITGFPNGDGMNTSFILVSVSPKDPGTMFDRNELSINVNYCCSEMSRWNTMPGSIDSQPYIPPQRKSAISILFVCWMTT